MILNESRESYLTRKGGSKIDQQMNEIYIEMCRGKEKEMLMPDCSTADSIVRHKHYLVPLSLCWDLVTLLTVHED